MLTAALTFGLAGAQDEGIKYKWTRQFTASVGGADVLLYSDSFRHAKITFGDLNGDGRIEMLVGTEDGRISRFDNAGTLQAPQWQLTEESLEAAARGGNATATRPIRTGGHAAPALVDLDGDGDLDLIVGTADGHLHYYRNAGTPLLPAFEFVTDSLIPVGLGMNLVPVAMDLNGDQAPDLLIGTAAGEVYLLMNSGTRRDPAFCGQLPSADAAPDEPPPCKPQPKLVASMKPEIRASPALADWSGDGRLELFVGVANGTIAYFENQGSPLEPQWMLAQPKFLAIKEGGYAAPAFLATGAAPTAPGGKSRPDLYLGSGLNSLSIYTNRDLPGQEDAWKVTPNALRIGNFGKELERVVLTAGDVDGDGDLDLMVGERSGAVYWIENVGTAKAPAWKLRGKPIVPESPRGYSAPLLVDLDGDGDLDLLVGGDDGRLWLMRNTGTPKVPKWQLETTTYGSIDVGQSSIPAVADIDGDGDLDLFVGNGRGLVIFYRNEGTAKEPDFRLTSTRFGDVSVGQAAAPAFFDWNDDKLPDLVVGGRDGRLALLVNDNPPGETQPRKWKQTPNWEGIQVRGFSTPLFADFNGDGKPDLMIGDGQGNLRLYINGGFTKPPPPPPPPPPDATPAPGTTGVGSKVAPPAPGKGTPNAQGKAGMPQAGGDLAAADGSQDASASGDLSADKVQTAQPPGYQLRSEKYADIQVKGRAAPAFGDVDGDGILDMLVGTGDGQILYYKNAGTKQEAKWTLIPGSLLDQAPGRNASPVIVDLDGDGLPDLLIGTEDGKVVYYKNVGAKDSPKFARREGNLGSMTVGRNASPTIVPVDKDPAGHLLVGNFAGTLFLYTRQGGAQSLNFKLRDRRFLGKSFGVSATPFVADMDQDGVLDLLIGSDSGKILHYVAAGSAPPVPGSNPAPQEAGRGLPMPAWKPGEEYFKDMKFPLGVAPRLVDIDGDGNLDLFIGTENGTILYYANTPGSSAPSDGKADGKVNPDVDKDATKK